MVRRRPRQQHHALPLALSVRSDGVNQRRCSVAAGGCSRSFGEPRNSQSIHSPGHKPARACSGEHLRGRGTAGPTPCVAPAMHVRNIGNVYFGSVRATCVSRRACCFRLQWSAHRWPLVWGDAMGETVMLGETVRVLRCGCIGGVHDDARVIGRADTPDCSVMVCSRRCPE